MSGTGLKWLLVALLPLLPMRGQADALARETPADMRRIVAQALCLAEAYPQSPVANDSAGVVAVYQGQLGAKVTARDLDAVRDLAREARPAAPSPVGARNLAIAHCVLFASRPDVQRRLGGPTVRK